MPPAPKQKTPSKRSTKRTSSRKLARSAPRKPFTVDHFRRYARNLVLDSGGYWEPEDFQLEFVEDLFSGHEEVWLIVPEGNGKTTLLAGVALYHADYTADAMVPIGASSRDQCEVLHNQAAGFVRRTPGLDKRFRIFDGYRRITALRTGGRIQVFAADDRTGDGVIPTLPLLDELHRHRDLRLYRTWRGKLSKRNGQLAAISTAGEPASEFEEIRSKLRTDKEAVTEGCHTRVAVGGMVLHDHSVPSDGDVEDMELVAQANPLSSITVKTLAAKRAAPTMSLLHWKRFVCNVATTLSGEGIQPEEWDVLAEDGLELSEGAWRVGWLDLGWKIDTTAMGILGWESHERRVIVGVKVIEPPKDGTVDEADVVKGLVELQERYRPQGWVFDPNAGGQQMIQLLDRGRHPDQRGISFEFGEHLEHGQGNAPMALAASRLDEAIRNRWIRHDGNPELRRHVLNAVRKSFGNGEQYRFDRPPDAQGRRRAKFPIDALSGVLMGHSHAVAEHEQERKPIVAFA